MTLVQAVLTHLVVWIWIVSLSLSPLFGIRLYSALFRGMVWLFERHIFRRPLESLHPDFLPFLDAVGYRGTDISRRLALHHLADLIYRNYQKTRYHPIMSHLLKRNAQRLAVIAGERRITQSPIIYAFAHDSTTRALLEYSKKGIDVLVIGMHRHYREEDEEFSDDERLMLFTRDLAESRQRLKGGLPVFIVADGRHGKQSISMPLCGYPRDFRTGFALLAVTTRAAVVPVMTSLQTDGRLRLEVGEAFIAPFALTNAEKLAAYVAQYAAVLTDHYRTNPEAIQKKHVKSFVKLVNGSRIPPDQAP